MYIYKKIVIGPKRDIINQKVSEVIFVFLGFIYLFCS